MMSVKASRDVHSALRSLVAVVEPNSPQARHPLNQSRERLRCLHTMQLKPSFACLVMVFLCKRHTLGHCLEEGCLGFASVMASAAEAPAAIVPEVDGEEHQVQEHGDGTEGGDESDFYCRY